MAPRGFNMIVTHDITLVEICLLWIRARTALSGVYHGLFDSPIFDFSVKRIQHDRLVVLGAEADILDIWSATAILWRHCEGRFLDEAREIARELGGNAGPATDLRRSARRRHEDQFLYEFKLMMRHLASQKTEVEKTAQRLSQWLHILREIEAETSDMRDQMLLLEGDLAELGLKRADLEPLVDFSVDDVEKRAYNARMIQIAAFSKKYDSSLEYLLDDHDVIYPAAFANQFENIEQIERADVDMKDTPSA